jgi:hypothetical protein
MSDWRYVVSKTPMVEGRILLHAAEYMAASLTYGTFTIKQYMKSRHALAKANVLLA